MQIRHKLKYSNLYKISAKTNVWQSIVSGKKISQEELEIDRKKFESWMSDLDNKGLNQKNFEESKPEFEKYYKMNFPSEAIIEQGKVRNYEGEVNDRFKINKIAPTEKSRRTGVIAYKMGMTGIWDKFGIWHPLTVLKLDRCQVTQVKTEEKDKYYSLQIGIGEKNVKKTKKPMIGHFMKAGTPAKKDLREFRVTPENLLPLGYVIGVRHFIPGKYTKIFPIIINWFTIFIFLQTNLT